MRGARFKQTEIRMIPESWSEIRLSDIIEIIGGGTPKTTVSAYWGGDIPWLSVVDFNNDLRKVYRTEKTITEEGLKNSSTRILKKGEIIISARGTVGAIAQLGRDMAFNQSCYGLSAKQNTINDFVYYLLKHAVNKLIISAHGSVFDTITRDTFDLIDVLFPPISEQQSITKILGSLDDKIALNRSMNSTLEAIGQALFKHWFVDFEFPNEEGKPYRSSGGEMVETELGEMPKGWRVGTIDEVTSLIIDHRGKTPLKLGGAWAPEGIPAISAKNIKAGRIAQRETIKFINSKLFNRWMKDKLSFGDILLTSEAPLGELLYLASNADLCLSQRLFGLRANINCCLPIYLYFWLNSSLAQEKLHSRTTGTTVGGIRQSELRKVEVLIPPLKIQEKISKLLENCMIKINQNEDESHTLTVIRDALLPKLMSGEIRVNIESLRQN